MVWGGPSIISGALFFILKGQAIRECLGRVFRESV